MEYFDDIIDIPRAKMDIAFLRLVRFQQFYQRMNQFFQLCNVNVYAVIDSRMDSC